MLLDNEGAPRAAVEKGFIAASLALLVGRAVNFVTRVCKNYTHTHERIWLALARPPRTAQTTAGKRITSTANKQSAADHVPIQPHMNSHGVKVTS